MTNLEFMYGKRCILSNGLEMKVPKLRDIVSKEDSSDSGYDNYVDVLTSDKYDIADVLWFDMHIWYEDIKNDWLFFLEQNILEQHKLDVYFEAVFQGKKISIKQEATRINDVCRNAFNYFLNLDGEYILIDIVNNGISQTVLCNVRLNNEGRYIVGDDNIKIPESVYFEMCQFIKDVNWIKKEHLFIMGGSRKAKEYILLQDYKKRKKGKKENVSVTLDSIVSSLIARGVSYNEVWDFPIYLVFDLYHRHIKIDEWNTTIEALHSKCIDTEKNPVDWDSINWAGVINIKH